MSQPEPETILQPSLHTLPEYCELVLRECESRGLDISGLREDLMAMDENEEDEDGSEPEWISEIVGDALEVLYQADYPCVEENDTLLIYPKGTPPSDLFPEGG